MNNHGEINGYRYCFHEKHRAWVIYRDIVAAKTTGGSWFESTHYKTEEELVQVLCQRQQYTSLPG